MPSRRSRPFSLAVRAAMPVYRDKQHGEDTEKEENEGESEGHGFRLSQQREWGRPQSASGTRMRRLSPALRRSSDGGYGCGAPPHVGHLTGTFSSAVAGRTRSNPRKPQIGR